MRSDLQHSPRPGYLIMAAIPETRVEETRVVNSKFSDRGIVRHHRRGVVGRNSDLLLGNQDVKIIGIQNQLSLLDAWN